jgi:hypothetical protein
MKSIPLTAAPSQSFEVQLSPTRLAKITIRTIGAARLYFTLDGVVTNRICRDRQRLLVDAQYHDFGGDFAFVDTQGEADPAWPGLGSRFLLIYLNDDE